MAPVSGTAKVDDEGQDIHNRHSPPVWAATMAQGKVATHRRQVLAWAAGCQLLRWKPSEETKAKGGGGRADLDSPPRAGADHPMEAAASLPVERRMCHCWSPAQRARHQSGAWKVELG